MLVRDIMLCQEPFNSQHGGNKIRHEVKMPLLSKVEGVSGFWEVFYTTMTHSDVSLKLAYLKFIHM